jgi:5-methyltetrahydrofolate--homocysteine methyltransferase
MKPLHERLHAGDILLCDGAMGTMLFERGLQMGQCPEAWNLERLQALEEIARLYFEAGADIVETNTFGGSPLKLAQYSLNDRTEEINAAAVVAVKRATQGQAYVGMSVGPCGRLLKPYGDTEPEAIRDSFERQIRAGAEAGADLIIIETMTDLAEAVLAVQAATHAAPTLPVAATMTFDPTPNGFYTIMGATIEAAARSLAEAGADIIGSNCGNGIENMVKIATEFAKHTSLPIIIQSNAGLPHIDGDRTVYPESPEFMAERVPALTDIGVRIIGGCCGTTPAHIAAFRRVIDSCN